MKFKMFDGYNKNIILAIFIIFCGLLVVGGTYAFLNGELFVTNGVYNLNGVQTTCFNVTYDVTNDTAVGNNNYISGMLFPSSGPTGGIVSKVTVGISPSCNVNGLANLYLNISDVDNMLIQSSDAHCENSMTLKVLKNVNSSEDCSALTNGVWVTTGTPLKYAIYNTHNAESDDLPIKVGYINNVGNINVLENIILYDYDVHSDLASAAGFDENGNINYSIYLWMDGNLTDDTYANLNFSAVVNASVVQADCDLTDDECFNKHAVSE